LAAIQRMLNTDPGGNSFGLEQFQDLDDIALDGRRGVSVEEEKKIQEEAPRLACELFILDLGQSTIQLIRRHDMPPVLFEL